MHDRLFQAHRRLEGADLRRYAGEVGLDVGRFERELKSTPTRVGYART